MKSLGAAVLFGSMLMLVVQGSPMAEEAPDAAAESPDVSATLTQGFVKVFGEPDQGAGEALLTLVGFCDYQSPYCAQFANYTLPRLEREDVHTGALRFVFRDLPKEKQHPRAVPAALAAHCAGDQGRFWPMHNLLFASGDRLEDENLLRDARTLGLDVEVFRQCLLSEQHLEAIEGDVLEGERLGIRVTPTFFLGYTPPAGEPMKVEVTIVGSQPYELFRQAIDTLVERKKRTAERGVEQTPLPTVNPH